MKSVLRLAMLILSFPLPLLAEGGGHEAPHMGVLFFASVFNFTLFVVLMYFLMRKPTKVYLRRRKLELEELINRVRRQQEELEGRKRELEAELVEFVAEKENRIVAAKKSAEQERAQILANAHRQAEQIVEDAGVRATQMLGQIAESARQEFVTRVLAEAAALVPKSMDASVDASYAALVADQFRGGQG